MQISLANLSTYWQRVFILRLAELFAFWQKVSQSYFYLTNPQMCTHNTYMILTHNYIVFLAYLVSYKFSNSYVVLSVYFFKDTYVTNILAEYIV